uniref:Uncharacterized protein n=1 Tax=Ascaris lumbricoides TaxID=6252 RepID=A0A0M3IJH6_ASCLU
MPSKAFIDGVQPNMTAIDQTISLFLNYDSCEEQLTSINERCLHLKRCCPINAICENLVQESDASQLYKHLVEEVKTMQNECERRMLRTLNALQADFVRLT